MDAQLQPMIFFTKGAEATQGCRYRQVLNIAIIERRFADVDRYLLLYKRLAPGQTF